MSAAVTISSPVPGRQGCDRRADDQLPWFASSKYCQELPVGYRTNISSL